MQTGEIGITEDLKMSVIVDQANSIENAWREAIQNAVDSEHADEVVVEVTESHTVVSDDGDGVELTQETGRNLLTNLGESDKSRDDDSTIGQFGVGKGQILAMGHTVFLSGDRALHFDIKDWGLEYRIHEVPQHVDGMTVLVSHYEDQVPDEGARKWDRYKNNVQNRFKYLEYATGTSVQVNGEDVGSEDPSVTSRNTIVERETDVGYIGLYPREYGTIDIYSNGVKVKSIGQTGFEGTVVTTRNLDLNFARNEIKDGCPVWETVRNHLDDLQAEAIEQNDDLNERARERGVELVAEGYDTLCDEPLLELVDGGNITIGLVNDTPEISFGTDNSVEADKVVQQGGIVLDEDDGAVEVFGSDYSSELIETTVASVAEQAEKFEVDTGHEIVHDADLESSIVRRRVCIARGMADQLGIDRQIVVGRDEDSQAWTDGENFIALTPEVLEGEHDEVWLMNIYQTLCHEYVHDSDTRGSATHNGIFDKNFRETVENLVPLYESFVDELDEIGKLDYSPEMTEMEKERARDVTHQLRNLDEGDEIYKNGDSLTTTVINREPLRLRGGRGAIYKVVWNGLEEFPELVSVESGNRKTVKRIEQ